MPEPARHQPPPKGGNLNRMENNMSFKKEKAYFDYVRKYEWKILADNGYEGCTSYPPAYYIGSAHPPAFLTGGYVVIYNANDEEAGVVLLEI